MSFVQILSWYSSTPIYYNVYIWNSAPYTLWEYFNNPALLCSYMTPIRFKNKYSCSFSIDFITFNSIDIYIHHNWRTSDQKNKRNSWFRLFKSNLIWFGNIRGYFGKKIIDNLWAWPNLLPQLSTYQIYYDNMSTIIYRVNGSLYRLYSDN